MATRYYEYRHIVGFEETNLVGNVYYVNHLRWQGRCRELFLRDHAPGILTRLSEDFALVTVRCSCEYLGELVAFDTLAIRMRLSAIVQNRIAMEFDYVRVTPDANGVEKEELVARGQHEVACMRRNGERTVSTPIPDELREALRPFGTNDGR